MPRLILHLVTYIANVILTYETLTRKRSLAANFAGWFLAYLAVSAGEAALLCLHIEDPLPYYAVNLLAFLPCRYFFEEGLAQKVFVFFGFWGLSSFVSGLCKWSAYFVLGEDACAVATIPLFAACYSAFIPLYRRYWRRSVREGLSLSSKGDPAYAALPLAAFAVFVPLFGPQVDPESPRMFAVMLLFEALILFVYYLLLSHLRVICERVRAEDVARSGEAQRVMQKRYYEEVERRIDEQHKLLHDVRHHFSAVSALIEAQDPGAASAYLDKLVSAYGRSKVRRYCRHDVVNAAVGRYLEQAEREGIAVVAEIDLPREVGIETYELCSLFGNALENALEACRRVPPEDALRAGRRISVKARLEAECLVVRIENSCAAVVRDEEGRILSSKGQAGGTGLRSIAAIVDRHRGCLSFNVRDGVFVLSALLYSRAQAMSAKEPPARPA